MNRRAPTSEQTIAWLFMTPALLSLTVFILMPFLLAIGLSFTNVRLGSPLPVEWVGWREYARLVGDAAFLRALFNNMLFALVVVPVQTALALGLALWLNRPLRGRVVFRTLFFMPVIFPLSLIAVVWILIYSPDSNALMNHVLRLLSLGHWRAHDFLHDPLWALPAIMLTSIWQGVGLQMVVLLAALQAIPAELYEAAAIDGAPAWQRFRHVTLPQLRNALVFVVVVTTILAFRVFDQVRIMTQGGPENHSATVVFAAVRAAFDRSQVARGMAMSVVFFLIVLAVTLVQRRLLKQTRG
ncbi:MAG: sugar ABC transporter permease [Gammaproteobacteria bacterium]|jgi:multiple sugar transport system permease protein